MERQKYKHFSARAVISAIVFSVGLWIYATLNSRFDATVQLPITVKLPENLAIESKLPSALKTRVRSDGWQLLNLLYFNSPNSCVLDLSKGLYRRDTIKLTRADYLNSIQMTNKVEIVDVLQEDLSIALGEIEEKITPIIPKIKIRTRDGFTLVGELKIEPKEVLVKGNKKALQSLISWQTDNIVYTDVYKSFEKEVNLSSDMGAIFDIKPNKVKISAIIQQVAEREYYDIPIKINGPDADNYKIIPNIITVELRGGVEDLAKLDWQSIKANISVADIKNDSTTFIKPDITFPGNAVLLNSEPKYLKIINNEKEHKAKKYERN